MLVPNAVVPSFKRIAMVRGIKAPCCGQVLTPQCFAVNGATIEITCHGCCKTLVVIVTNETRV